jgi:hypothetical protein
MRRAFGGLWLSLLLVGCGNVVDSREADSEQTSTAAEALTVDVGPHAVAYDYASLDVIPAGVAGGKDVVFVGSPLEGRVLVLGRVSGMPIGELPPPPAGFFFLPFIMHSTGPNTVAVLDAGGLPSPDPFIPANPTIYEYSYDMTSSGFTATLIKTVSFESAFIGFTEDFVKTSDGRWVISDAILGSLWVAETDGTVHAGIVPETFEPEDRIPELAFCETMPLITVGGIPFLFSGATLPGVSPLGLAERDGVLYFYSPCAEGLYKVPLATLSDTTRPPSERADDIQLVAPKPSSIAVEQLLGLTFNPFNPKDRWLYAADSLQLQIIRIDVDNGRRQVVADDPTLFNFPSSTAFLPPVLGVSPLAVVSNQQHRLTLTNAAITEDLVQPPFIVAKVFITN